MTGFCLTVRAGRRGDNQNRREPPREVALLAIYGNLRVSQSRTRLLKIAPSRSGKPISIETDMSNVFLSWSGNSSKSAAQVLRAWLPTVVQNIRPYMSAEDIDKGERWSIDITRQLEETNFGIICMTLENIAAPWVLFEAGALSKSIERSRVSPLLFGLNPSDFTKSPLLAIPTYGLFKRRRVKAIAVNQ